MPRTDTGVPIHLIRPQEKSQENSQVKKMSIKPPLYTNTEV